MQPLDSLAHQHGQHHGGGCTLGLHEPHERLRGQAEAVLKHLAAAIGHDLRQMIGRRHLRPGHAETGGDGILPGIGLEGFGLRGLGAVAADTIGVVFHAILHAVIVIQHRFQEGVDALPVAEAVVHGKPGHISVIGDIQHVIVGLAAPDVADARHMGRLHGQRILRVIHDAVFDDERIGKIGHPPDRPIQGTLEQRPVDGVPVGDLHGVDGNVYRQIDIGTAGNGHFLFFKAGARVAHASISSLLFIKNSWMLNSFSYRKSMQ